MIWDRNIIDLPYVRDINILFGRNQYMTIPRLDIVSPYIRFDPIPIKPSSRALIDVVVERAVDIYNKYPRAAVLWSGGVDSTLVLAALNTISSTPTTVLVTNSTYKHADPSYIDYLKSIGTKFISGEKNDLKTFVDSGGFFITGTHGDNLVLSDAVGLDSSLIDRVWDMTIPELLEIKSGLRNGDALYQKYGYLFDMMPYHIPRNAPNFLWWMGFCFNWHRNSISLSVNSDIGAPNKTHVHFFDGEHIQRYMINPVEERAGRTSYTHKNKVIDVIHQLVGMPIKLHQKTGDWCEVMGTVDVDSVNQIDDNFNITWKRW